MSLYIPSPVGYNTLMTFTLLHTADLHLGKSFSELPPERAGQRRADLLATLARICRTARERGVALLCIAGDLFDHARPATPLLASARHLLAEAGVPVLLIPGNHDALCEGSPYAAPHWPGNVLLASTPGWQRMPVADREVWAFGYSSGEAHRSPWQDFPGCGPQALLLLHAACLAPGLAAGAGYFPFTPASIPACAYLALGHHHRPAQVQRAPVAWYAGAPEPLEADETPPAVLHVTLDGAAASVEPLALATRRHRLISLEVTGLSVEEIWERALAHADTENLLTLKLTGVPNAASSLELPVLRAELAARCFGITLLTRELLPPLALAAEEGVLGVLRQMTSARLDALPEDDAQRARLLNAFTYAALALEGKL